MEQNVLQTLAAIVQQSQGNPDETLGQMIDYLVGEGMDLDTASEVAYRVLEQLTGQPVEQTESPVAEDEEAVPEEKCGGKLKVKKGSEGFRSDIENKKSFASPKPGLQNIAKKQPKLSDANKGKSYIPKINSSSNLANRGSWNPAKKSIPVNSTKEEERKLISK